MPQATTTGGGGGARGAGGEGEGNPNWLKGVIRSVGTFMAIQMAMKYGPQLLGYGGKPSAPAPAAPSTAGQAGTNPVPQGPQNTTMVAPVWPLGTPMSMILTTSTSPTVMIGQDPTLLVWDDLTYGNWKDSRVADLILDVPESVRHNGSWWLNTILVKGGGSDLSGKGLEDIAVSRKLISRYLPKKKVRKEKKLIGGDEDETTEEDIEEAPAQTIVSHWTNNLTLTIVSDSATLDLGGIQPHVAPFFNVVPPKEPGTPPTHYYPIVYANDFWLLKENMLPINETTTQVPLHVTYNPISSMMFNVFSSLTISMDQAAQQQGTGNEMDEIKRMLTETSPWLLATTALVTVLHMLFEFLAFSSDIGHWRKKDKDLVGVSLNTILTNCFVQLVILLYLHDSSEETSFMILFTQGIGLLIEAWKITKVVDVRVRPNPNSFIGYSVTFEDKKELSEEEKKTQEYDALAFRLVSYFAIPALGGYTVYSLLYQTHRGWYSFIVTTLAQAIYMFGFVQLVPQLIINYKLKSVAHIPMKAMMYKTLSTVVDDFFAFCVRMPWLHRLACFRDDVVFLVLLYQRWIYRVDYSRVNEYGQVAEGKAEPVGDKKAAAVAVNEKMESKKNK